MTPVSGVDSRMAAQARRGKPIHLFPSGEKRNYVRRNELSFFYGHMARFKPVPSRPGGGTREQKSRGTKEKQQACETKEDKNNNP